MSANEGARRKKEILDALRKLGEPLKDEEEIYVRQFSDAGSGNFAKMAENSGKQFFIDIQQLRELKTKIIDHTVAQNNAMDPPNQLTLRTITFSDSRRSFSEW